MNRVTILMLILILLLAVGAKAAGGNMLPEPTGEYGIGVTRLAFTDSTRAEPFTEDPNDHRDVTVTVWYPAEAGQGEEGKGARMPYYEYEDEVLRRFNYLATLAGLKTNSVKDAPLSYKQATYPVVLFNHGWGEHPGQSTILMEELASHGYVVFSLAHHYEAKFWIYPDGRFGFFDMTSKRMQQIMAEQSQPGMMDLFNSMFTTRGVEAQEALFRQTVDFMPTMLLESPRLWAEDIRFIIDELETLNTSEGPFKGRLDLDRIGVMGMSMGGAAAGQACVEDARIKAGINADGGLLGDLPDTTTAQPFMFMGSKRFIGYDEVFARHMTGDGYTLTVPEADHYDYTDLTLLLREHQMIGTIDGSLMLEIVNAYTLAFFDTYLKGQESELLQGKRAPYPEVIFLVHRAPGNGSAPGGQSQ
jgi:predicted dienelactone hydrolase